MYKRQNDLEEARAEIRRLRHQRVQRVTVTLDDGREVYAQITAVK
jgi:small nuclear ribonucleoprotein (snRNP)-like protein